MTDQSEAIAFLERTAFAGEVERIDTHAALVFLEDGRAWKMKRAVAFSFLDFTTLQARERALRDELRLNRRTAPDLYRRVVPLTRDGRELAIDGRGEPVEWLLEMARFPDDALYSRIADTGRLDPSMCDELAAMIVDFHRTVEPRSDRGGFAGMREVVEGNAEDLARLAGAVHDVEQVALVDRLSGAALAAGRERLEARRAAGMVRHCHGDLHLRNIVRLQSRPVLFDCIEFNDDFACIDVLYDLAFLLMDLLDRGLNTQAQRVLQGYVERTLEGDGLALLPLFIGCRAAIRAKVEGFAAEVEGDEAERATNVRRARHYLALSQRTLQPAQARLVAIGGRSGTGKSTLAAALAPALGPLPGAVVLRSDVIRKRLFGREPRERLPQDAYTPEVSAKVFATIADRALELLRAGHACIADGVYGEPAHREAIAAAARIAHVPFTSIWLEAPEALMEERVGARTGDASDADARVVRLQRRIDEATVSWHRLRADRPVDEIATDAQALIRAR